MTLLGSVVGLLRERGTPFALIGASAMAAHGVSRSTLDVDLLVTDARCLDAGYWASLHAAGITVDVRPGDASDPLAGVARLGELPAIVLDVVVGRHAWQAAAIAAAVAAEVDRVIVPVVRRTDLILLKLYAGGPQDAWDIAQLLDGPDRDATVSEVDRSVLDLASDAQALWRRLRVGPRSG